MTTVIYSDVTGALLATMETAGAIKDQFFDASWPRRVGCSIVAGMRFRGCGSALRVQGPERFG